MTDTITCKVCNNFQHEARYDKCWSCFAKEKKMIKCALCGIHYHDPKWDSCYKCYGKTKEVEKENKEEIKPDDVDKDIPF